MADEPPTVLARRASIQDDTSRRGALGLHTLSNEILEPYLEIIFVHGLLGDSRLTWTFGHEGAWYWPEWLFDDKLLSSRARVHSFGYEEPSVDGRVPVSKLRDIGISLCSEIALNHDLRRHSHNRIVFVAHSLGGLVVKAAITHARQNVAQLELARRFYSVLFMATPHWEAGDHRMLKQILRACNTTNTFLPEVEPNTTTVQSINDDFHTCSQDLRLWSFYEAVADPTVSRLRATLRHGEEMRVNADHAGVVRFRSSSDPTFSSIKDILRGLAIDIKDELENPERLRADLKKIAKKLNLTDDPSDQFAKLERDRIPGSCDWLVTKDSFKAWKDGTDAASDAFNPQFYWLSGDPGCGKSFLAARVVAHLRDLGCDTCSYLFKHGNISKQAMTSLLKTMAYQRARSSANLRQSLLAMPKDETPTADPHDLGIIWKQLFDQRVFQMDNERRQYWVIDALDEGHGFEDLLIQLQSLPNNYKIFITGRRNYDLERAFRRLGPAVISENVDKRHTLKDIRKYLEYNTDSLPADDRAEAELLIQNLEVMSNGSFLWAHLILEELGNYFVETDIERALRDVPDGMQSLYNDILRRISERPNSQWARTVLQWVVCATRPLKVAELAAAFRMDTKEVLKRPVPAIESMCGPLVKVEDGYVCIVHDTIRDFLFQRKQESRRVVAGFDFDKASSHEHVAEVCIAFMGSRLRHVPRDSSSGSGAGEGPGMFLKYACEEFSEHLAKGGWAPETDTTRRLVATLFNFFSGPILYWIEYLAQQVPEQCLGTLTRSGKNLKAFVGRRMNAPTELQKQLVDLQEWANDLIHLVTVFGDALLQKPEVIRNTIPPLCPPQSMINRKLGHLGVGLQVAGNLSAVWPDRIATTSYGKDCATVLASSESHFAVGLRSKNIVVYRVTTCQETCQIATEEPITSLEFAHSRTWLVAAGRSTLSVYNYESGSVIWTRTATNIILALVVTTDDKEIITVSRDKDVEYWDIKTETRLSCRHLNRSKNSGKPPQKIYISEELGLLVLVFRNEDVELYDLHSLEEPKGRIHHGSNIEAIAFNTLRKSLVMASYNGKVFTVEAQSLNRCESIPVSASHMAVSTNGKTIIIGTKQGAIHVRDSSSLELQHAIHCGDEEDFVDLCFVRGSLRFLDVRRHNLNVWEPVGLVLRSDDDDSKSSGGHSSFTSAPSQRREATAKSDKSAITALAGDHSGEHVFCAKESGTVSVYETARGKPKYKLFDFGRTLIKFLSWNEPQSLLASADNSGTVKVHHISRTFERTPGGMRVTWQPPRQVFQTACEGAIRQLLFSVDGELLLVSTTAKESLFNTKDGSRLCIEDNLLTARRSHKWIRSTQDKRRFVALQKGSAQTISWSKADPLRPRIEEMKPSGHHFSKAARHLVSLGHQSWAVYEDDPGSADPVTWSFAASKAAEPSTAAPELTSLPWFSEVALQAIHFLGLFRNKLVFLSLDNWICSVEVDGPILRNPIKLHFPVPHYWNEGTRHLPPFVSSKGDIIIPVDADLAIVRYALEPK